MADQSVNYFDVNVDVATTAVGEALKEWITDSFHLMGEVPYPVVLTSTWWGGCLKGCDRITMWASEQLLVAVAVDKKLGKTKLVIGFGHASVYRKALVLARRLCASINQAPK